MPRPAARTHWSATDRDAPRRSRSRVLAGACVALLLLLPAQVAIARPAGQVTLPPTQPGLGPNEGLFLEVVADDGQVVFFFIAGGTRFNITPEDVQRELQRNPLRFIRQVSRETILQFPEGPPIGQGQFGRVSAAVPVIAPDGMLPLDVEAPPAQIPLVTPQCLHVVRPGETLSALAEAFATSVERLAEANAIADPNRIFAGQSLRIPTCVDLQPRADADQRATEASAETQRPILPLWPHPPSDTSDHPPSQAFDVPAPSSPSAAGSTPRRRQRGPSVT